MAEEKETARLEAFSDGVFAIAMTLLVLELKVPHVDAGQGESASVALAASLLRQWPSYLAFLTSFFSVLIMWMHHHILFRQVRCADAQLLLANGLMLLAVTVTPFPTAVVAEYLTTPAARMATMFYTGMLLFNASVFNLVRAAAFRPSMLLKNAKPETLARLRASYRVGPPAYLIAVALAYFYPTAAMIYCTGLWIFWAITTREC